MRISSGTAKTLFALGFGYVAERLSRRLLAEGWHVIGTTRSTERADQMRTLGVEPVVLTDGPVPTLPDGSSWLVSTPPDREDGGCPGLTRFGDQADRAGWIAYLSTTAIHGDRNGGWVIETTPPSPGSPRGRARLEAEKGWQAACPRTAIFRLPGIYGPGRSVLDQVRNGTARKIEKPGQVFSRIHVDDIGSALICGLHRRPVSSAVATPSRTLQHCPATAAAHPVCAPFHVTDDWPSAPGDPIDFAAMILQVEAPEPLDFATADLSDMARSFYSECKRVGNGMTKAALGWRPAYPTFREGLRAILAEERSG